MAVRKRKAMKTLTARIILNKLLRQNRYHTRMVVKRPLYTGFFVCDTVLKWMVQRKKVCLPICFVCGTLFSFVLVWFGLSV